MSSTSSAVGKGTPALAALMAMASFTGIISPWKATAAT